MSCLVLTPNSLFAQRIDINIPTNYDVAGTGRITADPNYARVFLYGNIATPDDYYNFYAPSTYNGSDDSNNNTIIFHSTTTSHWKYGGFNWPFIDTHVTYNSTDVALKPLIEASSNTVLIYNDLNGSFVYGAYSVLSNVIRDIVPEGNIINSIFSFCNNRIEVSSFSNLGQIYGSYLEISLNYASSINLNSSFCLDNNHIVFNSSANVSSIYGSYLSLYKNGNNTLNLQDVSMSGNTIQINQNISNTSQFSQLYAAYLYSDASSNIQNLYVTNNKIIINHNLQAPYCSLGAFVNNSYDATVNHQYIENNTLQINANNILITSINHFDTFSFSLPPTLQENDTILLLVNQSHDITLDAHKLSISGYNAYSSPLHINLIDSYGSGNISLLNSNGSYLYETRTQLKVLDKTLIFSFNPNISPTPLDPIDPSDPSVPTPTTLDPQTIVISQGGAANASFVIQGLDLIMDEGLFSARNQAKSSSHNNDPFFSSKGLSPFAAFTSSKNKYFTSHTNDIDVNGFSIIAGLAKDSSIYNHNLTLGLFFEHGNSKFETTNFFDYEPAANFTVYGKGNAFYNGGGFLARLDFVNNIYFDASSRLGNASSDFFTSDLTKLSNFSYNYSTSYYGAHAGLGYLLTLNNNLALDFSGKYFFTNLSGKDVSLPENQSVSFENESISKIKIGAKIHLNDNDGLLNTYLGSGFEYEPTNKIKATISNQAVDTPELGGGRGLIEAGFNTSYKNIGIDLSAKYADGKAGNSMAGMLKFSFKI